MSKFTPRCGNPNYIIEKYAAVRILPNAGYIRTPHCIKKITLPTPKPDILVLNFDTESTNLFTLIYKKKMAEKGREIILISVQAYLFRCPDLSHFTRVCCFEIYGTGTLHTQFIRDCGDFKNWPKPSPTVSQISTISSPVYP